MQNLYGWTLLEKPIVLSVQANTTSFSLVDLPPQARKAKLYIRVKQGGSSGDFEVTWTLSTKVDMIKFSGHPYAQNAWSISNDNCSIRLDEKRIIAVSRSGSFPSGYFSVIIEVLGYK
ncbi:unnamed protein product [Paramecium octaurelia]|uniref:Uncharacterized protein n=1 Tax=Paramecium octaurelia TaxID=43137 RepID=A0A8S1UXD8_PAROT|nr:unnamed protein product [Paramecium octaurelia]